MKKEKKKIDRKRNVDLGQAKTGERPPRLLFRPCSIMQQTDLLLR